MTIRAVGLVGGATMLGAVDIVIECVVADLDLEASNLQMPRPPGAP